MLEFSLWCSPYCFAPVIARQALYWIDSSFSWKEELQAWAHMTSEKSNWLLINVLYIVSRDDLGRIGWNLRNRPIVLLIFWVIFFMCSTKFSLTSNVNPRCFWDILFFKGMSLNERQGWSSFLVFLLNITSCAYLVKSGLNIIFHWKAQLLIAVRSLRKVAALDWMPLTAEKIYVSSEKSLQFEDAPFDKSLM